MAGRASCHGGTGRMRTPRRNWTLGRTGHRSELSWSPHGLPSIRHRNPRIGTGVNPAPHRIGVLGQH